MLLAFLYACLRLLLDHADIRLRAYDPEAELLLLRHELRFLRRQVGRLRLTPADRAIMAAFHRLVSRLSLGGMVQPQTVLLGTLSWCVGSGHLRQAARSGAAAIGDQAP